MKKNAEDPARGPEHDRTDKERDQTFKSLTSNELNNPSTAELGYSKMEDKTVSIETLQIFGYFLLPLPKGKKFPPPKDWINCLKPYSIPNDGNVAIATRNGVAILITNDIRSTEWARRQFGPENVRSVRGAHWYFLKREGQKNEPNKETAIGQLEFHCENKYALIPPSLHPSGARYEWVRQLPPVTDLQLAPDLKDLFHPGGTHHSELLAYSAALAHEGKIEEEIVQALKEKIGKFPDPESHPDKEINEMARSAYEKFHEDAENRTGPKVASGQLDPTSWFIWDDETRRFSPYRCAVDYTNTYKVVTEYHGTIWQWIGAGYVEADGLIRSNLQRAAQDWLTPRQINEAVTAIQNLTRITLAGKIDLPLEEFMPLPEHVIPIDDGLLNLTDRTVSAHNHSYFYINPIHRHYIPGAFPTVYDHFLDILFTGDPAKERKKVQLYEVKAWALMRNYNIHGAVILFGQGGEGKSIEHNVDQALLPCTSISLRQLENDKWYRAELRGFWMNLISESTTDVITSEWFKRLTDGTKFMADRKNGQPFFMRNLAKFLIDTNELPVKDNEPRAFHRRVIAIIDFPNQLEYLLSPSEIDATVKQILDPAELDRIFSYVVDTYYTPLVQRMKFTGHLDIDEAERMWTERSNPALSFLQMKEEAGMIITDVEDAKVHLSNSDIQSYISREKDTGIEFLVTIKQNVIAEAKEWAYNNGFPAKNIDAKSLGAALTQLGYPNIPDKKRVGKSQPMNAWKNVAILPGTVTEEGISDRDVPDAPKLSGTCFDPVESSSARGCSTSPPLSSYTREGAREDNKGIGRYLEHRPAEIENNVRKSCSSQNQASGTQVEHVNGNGIMATDKSYVKSEMLANKLIDYLQHHKDPMDRKLSCIYDLIKNTWYPNTRGEEVHELINEVRDKSLGIIFDYVNQYVRLEKEAPP